MGYYWNQTYVAIPGAPNDLLASKKTSEDCTIPSPNAQIYSACPLL